MSGSLELAAKAEEMVRRAIDYLEEASLVESEKQNWKDTIALTKYADRLKKILIDDKGKSGLESLVRKMGGI